MEEQFDVLDENGVPTGEIKPRSTVHKNGDWHKAVHIWIVNDKNEVLLQKRALNKEFYPDMWDTSCAGHLSTGDTSITGAMRELKEELGLDILPEQLQLIGTRKVSDTFPPDYIDREFNDVYLCRLSLDLDKLMLQKEEVSVVRYVPLAEFKRMVQENDTTLVIEREAFEILFKALSV